MADVHEPEVRSYNMSRIRGKNTKPELLVRSYLHGRGLRYVLHDSRLPGKPDLVLPKYNCVVDVRGCFWHKHDCAYFVVPKTRTKWWLAKINATVQKDKANIASLQRQGWRTLVIWECELKGEKAKSRLKSLFQEVTGS